MDCGAGGTSVTEVLFLGVPRRWPRPPGWPASRSS